MIYLKIITGLIIFFYVYSKLSLMLNSRYNKKLVELLKNNYLGWHYDYIEDNLHKLYLSVLSSNDEIEENHNTKFLITKSANNRTMIIFQFKNSLCNGFFIQSRETNFKFQISSDLKNDYTYKLTKKFLKSANINYDVNNYLPKKYFFNNDEPNLKLKNPNSNLLLKFDLFYENKDGRYISYFYDESHKYKVIYYLLGLTHEDINSINNYILENNNKLLFSREVTYL